MAGKCKVPDVTVYPGRMICEDSWGRGPYCLPGEDDWRGNLESNTPGKYEGNLGNVGVQALTVYTGIMIGGEIWGPMCRCLPGTVPVFSPHVPSHIEKDKYISRYKCEQTSKMIYLN